MARPAGARVLRRAQVRVRGALRADRQLGARLAVLDLRAVLRGCLLLARERGCQLETVDAASALVNVTSAALAVRVRACKSEGLSIDHINDQMLHVRLQKFILIKNRANPAITLRNLTN